MVSHVDRHYWAKGTGFGTGSTTSSWDINATLAKKKVEEKYVSLCFAILAEYLSMGAEVKGQTGTPPIKGEELVEMLSDSCLLPALASYLHNDSGKRLQKSLWDSLLQLHSSNIYTVISESNDHSTRLANIVAQSFVHTL